MKRNMLLLETFRTIKRTANRYLAIILIVGLGVAFFSGIRATKPDMQMSADVFYDDQNFYDIRVLGTLGMTDRDVETFRAIEGIEEAEPAYSKDVLCNVSEKRLVVKMMSLPETINQISITQGRLPEEPGECFVDDRLFTYTDKTIGDTITIESGDDESIEDSFQYDTFTIVGSGTTPLYLSRDRGNSSIGSGTVSCFIMIPSEDFCMEAYTEVYLTTVGTDNLNTYSDTYQEKIDKNAEKIKEIEEEFCQIRFEEVQEEATEKLNDGEKEVSQGEEKVADAEKKLSDAEEKLADAGNEIEDAKQTIQDKKQELSDGEKELADAQKELDEAKPKLEDALQELTDAKKEIDEKQQELYEASTQVDNAYKSYNDGKEQIKKARNELAEKRNELEKMKPFLPQSWIDELEKQLNRAEEEINKQETELENALPDIDAAWYQVAEGQLKLTDARKEWQEGWDEYQTNLTDYEEGLKEVEENKIKIEDGKRKLTEAEEELKDAEADYQEALETFDKEKKEAEEELEPAKEELKDAREKLDDAKEQLKELEVPKWYVLDRTSNQSYTEFGQDAERIGAIGEVFPVIFFLVAALVALTTMTRMVEEERTQIGTLKALGYSDGKIALKYLFYAISASFIGSIWGMFAGQKILPYIIINAYKILYNNLPKILMPMSVSYSLMATAAAVLCVCLATWFACGRELKAQPSILMRPAAPKSGKRVILEHIPLIWKHLNFTKKATVRNLFRYKKRFFMTIFGIAGCMALLLVAFGLKDAIYVVGNEQFVNIIKYHAAITLEDDVTDIERENIIKALQDDERITSRMSAHQHLYDANKNGVTKEVYLIVPEDTEKIKEFITIRERVSKKELQLTKDGAVISEKLAKLLNVTVGDTISLQEDETDYGEVVISGITENYYMNYLYMSPVYYQSVFGEKPTYNTILTYNISAEQDMEEAIGKDVLTIPGVSQITFYSSLAQKVKDLLKSIDSVIMVLVVSAGALAFIVLYNLNNINVTERKRELSTLKVLGFYDGEVSAYVLRENIALTIIGCIAGVVLGTFLTRFVALTAEVDLMMFGREIKPESYLYSVLLTFLFTAIVNIVMHFSLKKVDMIEALKSVE